MWSRFVISFFLITLSWYGNAQQSRFEVGDSVPLPKVTHWLEQVPENQQLTDRFIVIDFWATWCGPCIAAVPHFNTLVTAYADREDIIFLSMSYESPDRIQRTLDRIDFQSVVVTDTTNSTQEAYGIKGIPVTLVIGPAGRLRWKGQPAELTEEDLREILQADAPTPSPATAQAAPDTKATVQKAELKRFAKAYGDSSVRALFEIVPTNETSGLKINALPKAFFQEGTTVAEQLSVFTRIPTYRIEMPDSLQDYHFHVLYVNRQDEESSVSLRRYLDQLTDHFGLTVGEEQRPVKAWQVRLQQTDQLIAGSSEQGSISDANGKRIYTAQTIGEMLRDLEEVLDQAIQWTGTQKGTFDFILDTDSAESARKSLRSYGFTVQTKTVELTFLTATE